MPINPDAIIDAHMHVGVIGDTWPEYGTLSEWFRQQLTFKIFLLYAGVPPDQASDTTLHNAVVSTIASATSLKHVVCLALDPVFERTGARSPGKSHVWTSNEYILKLQSDVGEKVLYGASVHPFDPTFKQRVEKCVNDGAVLIKWLPSAQQFSLGDPLVGEALKFLATAKGGKPLPLLLHCGPEYAIPTSDRKTWSYDFLSWNALDRIKNLFGTWHTPDTNGTERNLRMGLDAGAMIIFAHCGLPYFSSGLFGNLLEHSDFDTVKSWLNANLTAPSGGRCYADVSACCTPFRRRFFPDIANLPADYVVLGSDFPTPSFELYADPEEAAKDFKAVMKGEFQRIVIPADNLLDVNVIQLRRAFPGHPLFTNFAGKLLN